LPLTCVPGRVATPGWSTGLRCLTFGALAEPKLLQSYQCEVRGYRRQCQLAMADPLQRAQETFGLTRATI